ncbi:MAG: tetratricopeptide repeat protein [Chlamydiae bacterium]|nr:tetratricopeptide repeat protein [Chlamydiota bacterium]MBI3265508.1 tetratricopeptide repeat protein [Chlamydiota bacterium]
MGSQHEISQRATDFYEKAKEAYNMGHFKYASTLLKNLLLSYPDFHKARALLRTLQLQKAESGKFLLPKKVFQWIFTLPLWGLLFIQEMRKRDLAITQTLELILKIDPTNIYALKKLALTALLLGWTQTAQDTFEILRKLCPQDTSVLNQLAQLHLKEGNFEKSKKYFQEALKKNSSDPVAAKGFKDIEAMRTIQQGQWSDTSTYRNKIRDEKEANLLETQGRVVKSEEDLTLLVADLQKKLQNQPDNTSLLRELAKFYEQGKEYDHAIATYEKLAKLLPSDGGFAQQVSILTLRKTEEKLFRLRNEFAKKSTDASLTQQIQELEKQKSEMALLECKKRVERYPNQLPYRYELGSLYYGAGQFDHAIQEFQQAAKDPQKRLKALYYLGLCFLEKKFYDLAEKQLLKVSEELTDMDAFKKDVLYHLGLVYEAMNQIPKAVMEYKKIFEVDIAYKDVSQRVQKAYQK